LEVDKLETLDSHFYNWFGVLFFTVLYGVILLFMPFYKKMDRKPAGIYLAFVIAFAIEMHGIPFSMYVISWIIGKNLPEGVLWGHTLFDTIGYWGLYINIACGAAGIFLIMNGWYSIYKKYWSKETGTGTLVETGIYKYIRHPQYAGLLLLSLGMMVEWVTLPLLILYPVMVFMYVRLAKKEEQDMIEEFGTDYQNYMSRTKMFIPQLV
jgi:protein-S-isoprenylcysteine O-methyltransferase Ste14